MFSSALHDNLNVNNSQVMRDIINARMLEISNSATSVATEHRSPTTHHEHQSKERGETDEPKLSRETTKTDLKSLEEEKKPRRDSNSSHRHYGDRESSFKESSGGTKGKEKSRRHSRRSRSRERVGSRKRSRSASRARRHSGHSESRERDRHKGRTSRDRCREQR